MSKIEDAVCQKIQDRAGFGLRKYRTSLEDAGLSEVELLVHAQEEAMDLVNYLETLIQSKTQRVEKMTTTDATSVNFKRYMGVKMINATPMTRSEYNIMRGWVLPADEDGTDKGYLVEYLDGGKPNTQHFAGYVSWSPAEVFEQAYREVDGLSFGLAVEALKQGHKVARKGWNGKGMWLSLVNTGHYDVGVSAVKGRDYDASVELAPWIGMKTADNKYVPWLASQTDVLSEDWEIVQ